MGIGSGSESGRIGLPDKVGVAAGIIGTLTAVVSVSYNVADRKSAEAADARGAREVVLADALRMVEYDEEFGVRKQNEISLLGGDADRLITEYGRDRLHLSATLYRLMGQALAFSTTDLVLAADMLDRAAASATSGSLEPVQVARVRGDLAAQRQQPQEMKTEYDGAVALEADLSEPEPALDSYTRVYRLLDAYLGAGRATSPDIRAQFCAVATDWSPDLPLVQEWADRPLVRRQLTRAGVPDPAGLAAICPKGRSRTVG
jgi:hypothetical protein